MNGPTVPLQCSALPSSLNSGPRSTTNHGSHNKLIYPPLDLVCENGGHLPREERLPHSYASQFRAMVIGQVRSGRSATEVPRTTGVSHATVFRWVRQDRVDRGELTGTSTAQSAELWAAKARIAELEAQLATVKRDSELFSKGRVVHPKKPRHRACGSRLAQERGDRFGEHLSVQHHQREVPPRRVDQRAARDLLELGGSVLALTWESSWRPSKDFDACRCASKA